MNQKNYQASRDADGALVIHRVPIFVECSRNEVNFDAGWISQAVERAAQAAREGYYPPLHVRHHEASTDANDSVRAAGFFRIVGSEQITFKGSPRLAILADLVVTDPQVQAEILAKRLPYRSVEIFDVERPSIDSLALLDHEAPFLELPMLTVATPGGQAAANATFKTRPRVNLTPRDDRVYASFRRGLHAALLFREDYMAADDKKDDKKENMEAAPMDVGAIVKAIESGTISVADMEAIVAAIAKQSGGEAEAPEAPEAEMPEAAASKDGEPEAKMADDDEKDKPAKADTPTSSAMSLLATLQGQNEALFARIRRMEQEQERAKDVAEALKKLDGKPLGSNLESRLVSFHAEHGRKAFAAYVAAMDSTVGMVERSAASAANFSKQAESVPAVALKYQTEGVDAVDRAAKFAREWDYLHASGHTRIPQDRYVAVNMARTATKN